MTEVQSEEMKQEAAEMPEGQSMAPEQNDNADAAANAEAVAEQAAVEGATNTVPAEDPIAAMTAERDRVKAQLLRTAADFDNFRKRTRRDIEDAKRRAKEDILREVLPIIDNLERAVEASRQATEVKSVLDGVQMVLRGFADRADSMGLKRIESIGQPFDPSMHEAVQQAESADHAPGTVMAEVVPGYMYQEKLIRAAMVVVAKAPSEAVEKSDADVAEADVIEADVIEATASDTNDSTDAPNNNDAVVSERPAGPENESTEETTEE